MEPQLLSTMGDHVSVISTVALILFAAILFPRLFAKNDLAKIPLFGKEIGNANKRRDYFLHNSKQLYQGGYKKFKNAVGFRVTTADDTAERLVISPKYLDELRKLPDNVISFGGAIEEQMEKKYLKVPAENSLTLTPHVVKSDLTPALVRINPVLFDEVEAAVRSEIGHPSDWTPININKQLLRIVAIVSGRIFVGPELCHDETYIDYAINYTIDLMEAQRKIKELNPWLKPFQAANLPAVKTLRAREEAFTKFIAPTIEARRAAAAAGETLPDDCLTWLMDKSDKKETNGNSSTQNLAEMQLGLTFAAIHTTTMTCTNVFYNLAAFPEYTAPLRDEIRAVLAEHDGVLTFAALQKLRKLDSFIKESLRMDPAGFVSMARKVLQPFTLSSGEFIPAGTRIEVAAHAVSRDPDIYPEPDKFKPFRFEELRNEGAEGAARHQFVSVTQELMTFGYGRHACPGRFFAANEIKMIVARALLNYDIRMKDGETERYKNMEFALASIPDPTKELLFRTAEV